jgi:hypothetical protein
MVAPEALVQGVGRILNRESHLPSLPRPPIAGERRRLGFGARKSYFSLARPPIGCDGFGGAFDGREAGFAPKPSSFSLARPPVGRYDCSDVGRFSDRRGFLSHLHGPRSVGMIVPVLPMAANRVSHQRGLLSHLRGLRSVGTTARAWGGFPTEEVFFLTCTALDRSV